MRKIIVAVLAVAILPGMAWAQEPSIEELYQMIKKMERKYDAAIKETSQALAEAKAEAAKAKEEAVKAKAELARLKAEPRPAATPMQAEATPLIKTPETNPGFKASAEVLYMRPSRGDLDYVVKDNAQTGPDHIQGTVDEIEPDYQPGARFSLGYDLGSGTEIGMRFTGLKSHDSETAESSSGTDLWGLWLHPDSIIDDNDVDVAKARYDFEHYAIDLNARQTLNIGRYLGLSLEGGLRYASMNQDFDIAYRQIFTTESHRDATISSENHFSGWGPRLGVGLDWRVGYGFNVFSSVAGSVLMGDFDLSYREEDLSAGATTTTTRVNMKQGIHNRIIPVVEMKLGVGYARKLKNGWTLGANAGYEWQNWFNMVTAHRFSDDVDAQIMDTDTTDISLDGFFFEGFIHF